MDERAFERSPEERSDPELRRILGDVRADVQDLGADLKHLATAARDGGLSAVREAGLRVREGAKELQERTGQGLRATYTRVSDTSRRAVDGTRRGIQHRPLTYVAGVSLAGLLVGAVLGRRASRSRHRRLREHEARSRHIPVVG